MGSAALLLGEQPSVLELGGAVLICVGLAATLKPARAAAPPVAAAATVAA
jgi:drug/metabolite transporter (DMT)-like permease